MVDLDDIRCDHCPCFTSHCQECTEHLIDSCERLQSELTMTRMSQQQTIGLCERLQAEVERKNEELAAFSGWYVMWEEQIPKIAREAIETRLQRIATESKHTGEWTREYAEPLRDNPPEGAEVWEKDDQ